MCVCVCEFVCVPVCVCACARVCAHMCILEKCGMHVFVCVGVCGFVYE